LENEGGYRWFHPFGSSKKSAIATMESCSLSCQAKLDLRLKTDGAA